MSETVYFNFMESRAGAPRYTLKCRCTKIHTKIMLTQNPIPNISETKITATIEDFQIEVFSPSNSKTSEAVLPKRSRC